MVNEIIDNRKNNVRDGYMSEEGVKLNNLVYEEFSLSNGDIQEVENWYARRYPRLVEAQKENLAEQGKPTKLFEAV